MVKAFVLERKKLGKRADPEAAFKRMLADKTINLEERMTKEQVKRYICRLVVTRKKKTVVVRARRSDMEIDDPDNLFEWSIEEVEEGEWEIEEECGTDERTMEVYDLHWDYIEKNKKQFFT